jgi:C1A family cysteine protease
MKRQIESRGAPSHAKRVIALGRMIGAAAMVVGTLASAGTADAQAGRLGLIPDSSATISDKMKVSAPMAELPASVDLAARFPLPGNQGAQGSCVGWAIGYGAKSYAEVVEEGWSPRTTDHQFSPSWIYNQINGGVDGGARMSAALDLIVDAGADTIDNFPYNASNFTAQPNSASYDRAARFPAASWNTVAVSEVAIKSELARGNAVPIALQVLPDFDSLNSTTNLIYDSSAGSSRGGHAITLIGYDDARRAFRFINSWGTGWGQSGYGWLAYSLISDSKLGMSAYVLNDAPNESFDFDNAMAWYVSTRLLD